MIYQIKKSLRETVLIKYYYFFINSLFLLKKINKINKVLQLNEIQKARPFKFLSWSKNYCYFSGYKGNIRVFIKLEFNYRFLQNDLIAYNLLNKKSSLLEVLAFTECGGFRAIVFPFVGSRPLTNEVILEKPSILSDMLNELLILKSFGVAHRDIKLDNFLFSNNKVHIIDFTFAASLTNSDLFLSLNPRDPEEARTLVALGHNLKPNKLEWNDFYSLRELINSLIKESVSSELRTLEKLESCKLICEENMAGSTYKAQ